VNFFTSSAKSEPSACLMDLGESEVAHLEVSEAVEAAPSNSVLASW